MSFKYDLDKLLDPCGIEKFQKTITRITNPWKEYAATNTAMASIAGMYDNAALDAIRKASSSIAINESLGLEADTQKILAATTLCQI